MLFFTYKQQFIILWRSGYEIILKIKVIKCTTW